MAQKEMPLVWDSHHVLSQALQGKGSGGRQEGRVWGSLLGRNWGFHQGACGGKIRKRKGKPAEDSVTDGKA